MRQPSPDIVHGRCGERYAPLRATFARLIESGADLGASLAVYADGACMVDLWGGWTYTDRNRPWQSDTITNVWSTTKTMTALCALVLVDRGQLDLDAPVTRYWPEFGAAGKQQVLVRHVLSHTSGLSGWQQPVSIDDLYDWERCTALLAAQQPWWTPGTASGYQALNYGHLVGELVRRVSGLPLGRFFAEQIAAPLGADFHIGLPRAAFHRVADVVPPPPLPFDLAALERDSVTYKTLTNPAPQASVSWTDGWRMADLGAANGHGNARSVARIQSALTCGGTVGGVPLLSPRTIERIFEVQADGIDLVLGLPMKIGIGYGLPQPELLPFLPQGRICFWGGWGGSMVINDVDRGITMAYVMNKMAEGIIAGPNIAALATCLYRILDDGYHG